MKLLSIILAVFFLLTGYNSLNAQNLQRMSIEREEAGTGIPVFAEHPDKAGIVIESSVPGLRFSSNMQGIVEVKEPASGRYVLIIEPFTQIIRVDAENYVQERFRVGNPEARDVLYFSVRSEERQSDLISVIFNVEPEDALLFLDDHQVETNTTVQLPTQGYELRLEREGYYEEVDYIIPSPEKIHFNYSLETLYDYYMVLRGSPKDAVIVINGLSYSQNSRVLLKEGKYDLQIWSPGYESEEREVSLESNRVLRFNLEPLTTPSETLTNLSDSRSNIRNFFSDSDGKLFTEKWVTENPRKGIIIPIIAGLLVSSPTIIYTITHN